MKHDVKEQLKIIKRGIVEIITSESLEEKLYEERPLNVKFGVDPTAPDIHLGHTVPLQKLKQFQELGHNIQLVIGDYTAMIGDPSEKSETRPMLSSEKIKINRDSYTKQVFKVLDANKTNLLYNSEWLSKFSGTDMIKLCSRYTVQKLIQRRDFSKRLEEDKPLSVSELIYPLLVGYDSVYLGTDIEIGGTDQLFNFMASRDVQKAHGQTPEVIITLPLLEGTDGIKKMSKSLGNSIGVDDDPIDIYGKIMSISDSTMIKYYELLSDVSLEELEHIKKPLKEGKENPMIYKERLAMEITEKYHGSDAAHEAQEFFIKVHKKKKVPDEMQKIEILYKDEFNLGIIDILRKTGRALSNSEARRLIEQGGIRIDDNIISDINYHLEPRNGTVLKVGKQYFRKLYFKVH